MTSGSPMATADPKVKSRMTAAAMSPMPSDPNGAVQSLATGPTSTWRRLVAGGEHRFDQFLASGVNSLTVRSTATSAYAVAVRGDLGRALVGEGHDTHDVPVLGDVGEDLSARPWPPTRRPRGVDHDLDRVPPAAGSGPRACRGGLRLGTRLQVVLLYSPPNAPARAKEPINAAIHRRRPGGAFGRSQRGLPACCSKG